MDDGNTEEMLVTRRSKRSTAGNRMEAVMAEMGVEDLDKDVEDDNDFINDKIEEDIFGSDFESTDEEAEKAAETVGELEIANEERLVKKTARTRLERVTAAAHARNRLTFNPDIQVSVSSKLKPKEAQHVSQATAVDAELGQRADTTKRVTSGKKRKSQRKHTIQNTSATVTRLKQSQAKRASQPKKAKVEYKTYTQGELIALALDTEEGNIVEHRDYLKNEAEKRKRARVVRTAVGGPLLRWISKREEVKTLVPPPPPPVTAPIIPQAPVSSLYRSIYGPPGSLFTPTTYSYAGGATMVSTIASTSNQQTQGSTSLTFSPYQHYLDPTTSAFPMWPPPQSTYYPTTLTTTTSAPSTTSSATFVASTSSNTAAPISAVTTSSHPAATPQPPTLQIAGSSPQNQATSEPAPQAPSAPEYKLETVTKNYVMHELDQRRSAPKPTWAESMQAMFGDHVKWDEIKVFVGKGRPLSRPRQTCPITGRQAHYLDPRTGIPYADSHAYKVLTGLLRHEYIWNPSLGCYLGHGDPPPGVLERQGRSAEWHDDAMDVDS